MPEKPVDQGDKQLSHQPKDCSLSRNHIPSKGSSKTDDEGDEYDERFVIPELIESADDVIQEPVRRVKVITSLFLYLSPSNPVIRMPFTQADFQGGDCFSSCL